MIDELAESSGRADASTTTAAGASALPAVPGAPPLVVGAPPKVDGDGDRNGELGAIVAHLSADRLCVRCHQNLAGQPVYREPRYGLIVVRCPECGGVTPMLEYPTLGRWGARLGAVLAAFVLLAIVAFMFASAGIVAVMAYGVGGTGGSKIHQDVYQGLQAHAGDRNWWSDEAVYREWVEATGGVLGIVEAKGGWLVSIAPVAALPAFALVLVAFAFGVVIATFTPGQRGLRLAVLALLPAAIGACYMIPFVVSTYSERTWGAVYSKEVSQWIELPLTALALAVIAGPCLMLGALLGRRVARGLVRAFLPPRHRPALSYLWICDRLPAPPGATSIGPKR